MGVDWIEAPMLGFGSISSRAISGSPQGLVLVPLFAAATGALLTFSGTAQSGAFLSVHATGRLVTFGGTANSHWTQTTSSTGSIFQLDGSALLRLAGKPLQITALAEPYRIIATAERFAATAIAQPYRMKGF